MVVGATVVVVVGATVVVVGATVVVVVGATVVVVGATVVVVVGGNVVVLIMPSGNSQPRFCITESNKYTLLVSKIVNELNKVLGVYDKNPTPLLLIVYILLILFLIELLAKTILSPV